MLRNRFYICRCLVAISGEVKYRFRVSVLDYILCIAWVQREDTIGYFCLQRRKTYPK